MKSEPVLEAPFPPELLGRKREDVKLLVINRQSREVTATGFKTFPDYVKPGDVIVFNNSSLIRASFPVYFADLNEYGQVNVGTSRIGNKQLVEIRPKELNRRVKPYTKAQIIGNSAEIRFYDRNDTFRRFFWADSPEDNDLLEIAHKIGKVIRYNHIPFDIPETFYDNETDRMPGSVEYPSAARPFTRDILQRIISRGAVIKELTLHCNLGSLESPEFEGTGKLLDERFWIPEGTAGVLKRAKETGNKVIAVGTSVVRALESAFNGEEILPGGYSTELYIHGDHKFRLVDSILTGMHEDEGSHIGMISAFTGNSLLRDSYSRATEESFSWHEFGDLALIL